MHLTSTTIDTINILNQELDKKNTEIEEQNDLNIKFASMIEEQNEQMSTPANYP